jgi:hypothetical protein
VEFNRNQYFFLGVVIVLMGFQFRVVSEFVLTEDATQFLAERMHSSGADGAMAALSVGSQKVVHPPEWLGWCMISVGAVLILHSLAMPRPG